MNVRLADVNELNRINELRKQLFEFQRVELCVWEFNRKASAVYEAAGFHTYKRSMEMIL